MSPISPGPSPRSFGVALAELAVVVPPQHLTVPLSSGAQVWPAPAVMAVAALPSKALAHVACQAGASMTAARLCVAVGPDRPDRDRARHEDGRDQQPTERHCEHVRGAAVAHTSTAKLRTGSPSTHVPPVRASADASSPSESASPSLARTQLAGRRKIHLLNRRATAAPDILS